VPRLEARHLAKSYWGRRVVRDVSIAMESGQIVGLLGPNGAGKTTTFGMVVGLTTPDRGRVLLDDRDGVSPGVRFKDAELLGMPAETSSTPLTFNKDTQELVFKIKVNPAARPGKYAQLVCRTTFMHEGEPVVMTVGTGELRVDAPLPPKPMAAPMPAAAPPPMPTPAPAAPKPPEQKRLTRLEQLRLEKEKAEKK